MPFEPFPFLLSFFLFLLFSFCFSLFFSSFFSSFCFSFAFAFVFLVVFCQVYKYLINCTLIFCNQSQALQLSQPILRAARSLIGPLANQPDTAKEAHLTAAVTFLQVRTSVASFSVCMGGGTSDSFSSLQRPYAHLTSAVVLHLPSCSLTRPSARGPYSTWKSSIGSCSAEPRSALVRTM